MERLSVQIYRATILEGGSTRSVTNPKQTIIPSGYSVARAGKELVVSEDVFNPLIIENFVVSNYMELQSKETYIGTWLNDGKVYIDVVDVVQDKETAIRQGVANKQQSIYDNNRYEVIDMPPIQNAGTHTQQKMYLDMKVRELVEANSDDDRVLCDHDFIPVNNDGKHECRFCGEVEVD